MRPTSAQPSRPPTQRARAVAAVTRVAIFATRPPSLAPAPAAITCAMAEMGLPACAVAIIQPATIASTGATASPRPSEPPIAMEGGGVAGEPIG